MDKLKAFETFASVATRGSLSAAARAEGVAPAVVSRRLDALEEHLGVKLLVRTTRRIALTHEGTAFLDDCQRLLADVAGAEASVSAGGVQASGHLRLTAPAGFGRRHVAPLVPAFHAEHPRLRISLNLSDRVVELAAEGYDCAVRVGDLPDSSLVSIRLADNRRQAVAAPAYLARRGTPQHPRDLARHDCLVLSSDASQTRGWAFRVPRNAVGRNDERTPKGAGVPRNAVGRNDERTPKGAGVPRNAVGRNDERTPKGAGVPRHAVGRDDERTLAGAGAPNEAESELTYLRPGGPLDCSDGQVLHDWCLAGHGIAWRSTWEVEGEIAAGLLVPVLEDFAAPPNGIYAILPHATRHLPLRVRLWVDFLRQRYGDPAFWRAAAQADS
ncbi:MAG: LysR family transcriptional regulator [Ottowia sp.]|nr:LysR family transcriptional regulator [Ottowia sp.]